MILMFNGLFKKTKYITVSQKSLNKNITGKEGNKPNIPEGMWEKCPRCGQILYKKDLKANEMICGECRYHFRISAAERIELIIDEGTFIEFDSSMQSENPIEFRGYDEKVEMAVKATGVKEAVITGMGKINGMDSVICVMDSRFFMGSMGSVVGEKITRALEKATELKLPIIIFTTSGGARMQEGMFSLMQMAKVSSAVARHDAAGLLYITVLTDPTTGGVTASFAMQGDIIIAEPGALIGFAGARVIEQTIGQKLPQGFQRAEFLLKHGFIDMIAERKELKDTLGKLICMHA
jgi:acetyl-CoA carboxylase carboxyl transferase subunit beta